MTSRLFVDAGAWIAHRHLKDRYHDRTLEGFAAAVHVELLTTDLVLAEAATWLRYRTGLRPMLSLRDVVRDLPRLRVLRSDDSIDNQAWDLLERVDDLSLSFADAVTAVVVKRERCDAVFGFDSDFLALGIPLYPGTGVGEASVPYVATPIQP